MYCPECGGEYREGFFECADCQVPLVAEPPVTPPVPDLHLVTVLESSDPTVLAVAESLLMEAEVPYLKKGDQIQDLFAWGRLFTGFNPVVGPVQIQVAEEHADSALEILEALTSPPADEGDAIAELELPDASDDSV